MVRESLLAHIAIPPGNVHPIPTEGLTPEASAERYGRALAVFDVLLLGLGTDGHTASLFPGTAALGEDRRPVVAVTGARPEPRITLTYPALETARVVAFLVTGADKRDILARVLAGDPALPATRLAALPQARIFADRAAAPSAL
jgi:6-phosphogluconolactonase